MFFSTPPVFSACPGGDSRHVDDTSFYKARAIDSVSLFQHECEFSPEDEGGSVNRG
jgi:hypothetical protein